MELKSKSKGKETKRIRVNHLVVTGHILTVTLYRTFVFVVCCFWLLGSGRAGVDRKMLGVTTKFRSA